MPSTKHPHPSLSWLAAVTALGAFPAQAQDRGLASPFGWPRSPALEVSQTRAGWDPSFNWGPVRLMPSLQVAPGGFWGADLSVDAGGNWFARVGVARDAVPSGAGDTLMLSGGYRVGGQQSISLQLVRDRRDSLGLAVSYDWPRYYVRIGLDHRATFAPETLRFSAGMRF